MRLLVRRIYRAFPELDRFSDEQCRRFVRAANRGWRRGLHWTLILAALIPSLLGSAWAADKAFEASNEYQNSQRHDVLWADITAGVATIPLFVVAMFAALVVRDVLLRRRIGRILRRDSACPKCNYRLVGLAVSKQSTITCPECGFEANVDPALSELTINAQGKREFIPAIIAPPSPPFWTRKNIRRVVRITALIMLMPVLAWAGLVWWVGKQIDAAAAWQPPNLGPIIESRQPPDASPQAPDGWTALESALAVVMEVNQAEWGSMGLPYNAQPLLVLIDPSKAGQLSPQQLADATARAQKMMDLYRSRGVYQRLRDTAACRRAMHNSSKSWVMMRSMGYGPQNTDELVDICAVRMELARRAGDLAEFTEALEARLALARILRQLVDGQSFGIATSIETSTFTSLESHLATRPSKEWLDAVDAVIGRQCTPLPTTHLFDADQAGLITMVRDIFLRLDDRQQRPEVRFLEASYEAYKYRARVGSFDENRSVIEAYFKDMEAYASQPPFKRTGSPPAPPRAGLAMTLYLFPDESPLLRSLDEDLLHRRAYEALSALERFRLAHGDYPQKLDELQPDFLKALPEDPWSGKPLGYVRVDPARDRQKRSFLLYSVGVDRTDNGGTYFPQQVERSHLIDLAAGPSAQGSDYIINETPDPENP